MHKFFSLLAVAEASAQTCPPQNFSTVNGFDLDAFISKRWYGQQQMAVNYLPVSTNRCVYADYSKKTKKNFWGYDVAVHNYAESLRVRGLLKENQEELLGL